MRHLLLIPTLLLSFACSPTPAADTPDPSAGGDTRCPPPTGDCMNADNHAQCLEIAATCAGEIIQLESCPLQFSCAAPGEVPTGPTTDPVPSPDPAPTGYDPCAGKSCGDQCNLCPPDGDPKCLETTVVKMCDANGQCSANAPTCQ